MHLEVTFRNLNPRDEVRNRAQMLFGKLERFLDPAAEGQLVILSERGASRVEVVLTSRGAVHKASEEDEDLRTALDRLFHRLENQLRRAKERRIDRSRRAGAELADSEPEPEDTVTDDEGEEEDLAAEF